MIVFCFNLLISYLIFRSSHNHHRRHHHFPFPLPPLPPSSGLRVFLQSFSFVCWTFFFFSSLLKLFFQHQLCRETETAMFITRTFSVLVTVLRHKSKYTQQNAKKKHLWIYMEKWALSNRFFFCNSVEW